MKIRSLFSLFISLAVAAVAEAQNYPLGDYAEPANPHKAATAEWARVPDGVHAAWASRSRVYAMERVPEAAARDTVVYAWRGERLGLEAVVWSKAATGRLSLSLTPLRSGKRTLPSSAAVVRYMNYVLTDSKLGCGDNNMTSPTRLVPDIIGASAVRQLGPMTTRPVWVTVEVPRDVRAGDYSAELRVTDEASAQVVARLRLTLRIVDRTLPRVKDWTFHTDFWQQPYAVSRYHKTGRWTQAHFNALRPYLRLLARAGQKVVTTILFYEPWGVQSYDKFDPMIRTTLRRDGSWSYDYTIFDHYVSLCDSVGINGQINCYSMIPWDKTFRYYDEAQGKDIDLKAETSSEAYRNLWTPFLRAFAAHLRAKGWYDKTCIAMDERGLDDMLNAYKVIENAVPGMKVALAGSYHKELVDKVYDYCLGYGQTFPEEDLKMRRAKGFVSTVYTCCSEIEPSIFTNSNPADAAYLPLYAAANRFDGYLHWSWENWTEQPLLDSRFMRFPAGDTYVIYPGDRSSVRHERYIEGVESVEKYRVLAAEYTRAGNTAALAALDSALALFKAGPSDAVPTDYAVDRISALLNTAPAPARAAYDYQPDPNTVYTLSSAVGRGKLYFDPASPFVWSTGRSRADVPEANYQWAFIPAPEKGTYYLYNVGRRRFAAPLPQGSYHGNEGGLSWMFTSEKRPVRLKELSDGSLTIRTADDNTYLSVHNSYMGPVITYFTPGYAGASMQLTPAGELTDNIRRDIVAGEGRLVLQDIMVGQGYQTTGRGNRNSVLLKFTFPATQSAPTLDRLDLTLKGATRANIDSVKVFLSDMDNFPADAHPRCVAAVRPAADRLSLPLKGAALSPTAQRYLYVCVNVRSKAALGADLDARVDELAVGGLGMGLHADPPYAQKVYAVQRFIAMPDTYDSHYYRIPALVTAPDGSVVVAFDKRFDMSGDAGSHRIDIVVRRSEDNGRTWSEPLTIAQGQGKGSFDYGFGDPALVVTKKGRIICLSCAGNKSFWDGQTDVAIMVSDDNGKTWTRPADLVHERLDNRVDNLRNALGSHGFFVTSGRGLCTSDGTVMFACNYKTASGQVREYVLYSKDEGDHWTLDGHMAYDGANEAKLLEMNDGRLMMSIRQAGDRGFNITSGRNLDWGKQWRDSTLRGASCNAEPLYYRRDARGRRDLILHTNLFTIPGLQRADLWLCGSTDQGRSWRKLMQLQPGAASYSTIDRLRNGDVTIFFEDESNGVDNWALNYIVLTRKQLEQALK